MNISEKQLDFTTGAEEVSELDLSFILSSRVLKYIHCNAYHGYKVGAVRSVLSESETSKRNLVHLPTSGRGAWESQRVQQI